MVILVEHEYNKLGIDSLVYSYDTGGNQLTRVTDSAPTASHSQGFLDGNTTGGDYNYDLNGNMTQDKNKGITQITYNHLNLPQKIVGGSQTIEYIYSANGQKLQKKAPNNEITRYSGNFIYESTSLKQVLHSEGYIDMNGTPTYHYYLKDHLGNNRMVVNQSGTVVQQTDYYPFGMTFNKSGSSDNKYLYNSKELQEDAIGNGMLDWLDYGGRGNYDPQLGRFHSMDILTEAFSSQTPYAYAANNPVLYIDYMGLSPMVGADGLTNEQWIESSRPGASEEIANRYRRENMNLNFSQNKLNGIIENAFNGDVNKLVESGLKGYYTTNSNRNRIYKIHIYGLAGLFAVPSGGGGEWIYGAETGLFLFGMLNEVSGHATQAFQSSNKGVLRAAVNNNIPTDNIKGIMRSTSKFANGVKWGGIAGNSAGVILTGVNIYNEGWTAENSVDLLFNGVAFIPGYGWGMSTLYSGTKYWGNSNLEMVRKNPEDAIRRFDAMNMAFCFPKGSLVLMNDHSYKRIESIQIGDSVLTYNFAQEILESNPVHHIDSLVNHKLIKTVFDDGKELISTEDHPYYVDKKGWCSFNPQLTIKNYGIDTGQLEVSDFCFIFKASELNKVKVIQIMQLEKSIMTYNLTKIANSNNYFVNGVLVHNGSIIPEKETK
jgi:RHS repeat-associated protein